MRKKSNHSTQLRPQCLISTWEITCAYMQPPRAKKATVVPNQGCAAPLAHDNSHVKQKKYITINSNLKPTHKSLYPLRYKLKKDPSCDHSCAKRAIAARNRDYLPD